MESRYTSKYLPPGTDLDKLRAMYKEFKEGKTLTDLRARYGNSQTATKEPELSEEESMSEDEEENAPDISTLAQKESTARPNSENESEDEEPVDNSCLTQKEPSAGTTLADTSEEESMSEDEEFTPTHQETSAIVDQAKPTSSLVDENMSEEDLPQPSSSKKSKFAMKSASSKDSSITKTSFVTAALAESEDEMMEDVKEDPPATQENADVQQEIASEDKRMSRWSQHKNIEYKKYLPGTTEIDPTEFYSKRKLQKLRRKERGLTAGDKWNHLKAPELTEELKNELAVFSNKRAIDPKLFYKRSACMKEIPKHFQYGTVIESRSEYFAQGTKKASKKSLVQTLLENAEWMKSVKEKVATINKKQGHLSKIRNMKIKGFRKRKSRF